jgi:hypothetical protein
VSTPQEHPRTLWQGREGKGRGGEGRGGKESQGSDEDEEEEDLMLRYQPLNSFALTLSFFRRYW